MTYKRILKEINHRINYLRRKSKELEIKKAKLCEGLSPDELENLPDNHPIIVKNGRLLNQISDISGEILALEKLKKTAVQE